MRRKRDICILKHILSEENRPLWKSPWSNMTYLQHFSGLIGTTLSANVIVQVVQRPQLAFFCTKVQHILTMSVDMTHIRFFIQQCLDHRHASCCNSCAHVTGCSNSQSSLSVSWKYILSNMHIFYFCRTYLGEALFRLHC